MITAVQQLHKLNADSIYAFCICSADKHAEKSVKIIISAEYNEKVTYFYYQKKDYYVRSCLQAESNLKQ